MNTRGEVHWPGWMNRQLPSWSQHAPMHGLGWQTLKFASTVPTHWVVDVTSVHVPTLEQQATGGATQGLGLQPLPLNHVPVHWDCGARKHPPAAVQHAPFTTPQGVGLQTWPRKGVEPFRLHRSGLVRKHAPSAQQHAAVTVAPHAATAQVWLALNDVPPSDWQFPG